MRRPFAPVIAGLASAVAAAAVAQGCGAGRVTVLSPGQAAASFLTPASASMTIEVTPVSGEDPDEGALSLLLARATEHCNKPGGISIVLDPDVPAAPPPADGSPRQWTLDQLGAFAAAHRTVQGTPGNAVLHIVYVDGLLASPPNVLGASFGPTQIAVFKDQLRSSFGSSEPALEGRVLVHEMGHELGLVNEGIPMITPHEDPAHPAHCDNSSCVMFWTLHGALSPDQPLPPDDYDADCLADLRAAGGK